MIKNYLRSAFRNIKKHPFISFINIFGLTVGLTCCLLILVYVINEKSYDKFNKAGGDIYRVTTSLYSSEGAEIFNLASIAAPFAPLLQNEFPDIKKTTRLLSNGTTILRYKDKLFNEQKAYYADENFFDFFNTPVISGAARTALAEPYSMMITENIARKYFGNTDPVNKIILLDANKRPFKVTGIFKEFPANSHLHPQILLSFNTLKDTSIFGEKQLRTDYYDNNFFTYLLFPKNYNVGRIEAQLPNFLDKYVPLSPGFPAGFKTHKTTKLELQKLSDIHLRSHLDNEIEENGDIERIYIFSAIALFILLIASINYMNLSTARSALRAKEIGIRKVIGAERKEIISQFLSESVLITWVAFALAIVLTIILLPFINKFSNQYLSVTSLLHWRILLPALSIPFVIGLVSGIYPAIFMSSFAPVKVLKGVLKVGSSNLSFRKVLVVIQFSISIILIVATTIVYRQLKYMQNKDLGFNKDSVIVMKYPPALNKRYIALKYDLLKNSLIKEVAESSNIPTERLLNDDIASVTEAGSNRPVKIELKYINVDYGFIPAYNIGLAAGRNFSKDFTTDTSSFIIDEAAVQALGWKNPQNAVGKDLMFGTVKGKIVGIVKDFQFESLHQRVIPLLFQLPPPRNSFYDRVSIKISRNNVSSTINAIENAWNKNMPDTPFEFTFLDQKLEQLYLTEQQQGVLFTIFSGIAIFIACLGLFGLSAFTITQRVKEIGVRKVLGASVSQIVVELSGGFLQLVLFSTIIAFPIAWYLMNKWLVSFAFRVGISWWIFVIAGTIAILIAFATISFQSIKAALANPVKSLRSE